jgi:pimeloyl-ACP methyl ester carboxylesterase
MRTPSESPRTHTHPDILAAGDEGLEMTDAGSHLSRSVVSGDGTSIGYRESGRGPGLVLIHGGMMSARNFTKLAAALSADFTVYVADRRGRGRSGGFGADYHLHTEVEDVAALLQRNGAHHLFGLSSGGIIALQCALELPVIRKVAVYEPPLPVTGINPAAWVTRYDTEIAAGNLPAAMVTLSKGVPVSAVFSRLPRPIGTALMRLAIPADARTPRGPDDPSLQALIPTMHYDAQIVTESATTMNDYPNITADVLLLGGTRSPRPLRAALDWLDTTLPQADRVELRGAGHMAADNSGRPERVARHLRRFFTP